MRIAVIGGSGQLGTDVARAFAETGAEVTSLTHDDVEITNIDSVVDGLACRPRVIVNTAAMHNVEQCESDPAKAFAVNALGARNLALAARDVDATLIHISTDYVFDGSKSVPYEETDCPRPLNAYGNSKLSGEHCVRSIMDKHFVVRTSGLYGAAPCRAKGRNFVELMLHLARERGEVRVVDSEWITPTSTRELSRQILALSRSDAFGLYHATAESSCSWYQFAQEIFRLTNTRVNLKIATSTEFPAKVPRPTFSVLENRALKARGLSTFASWQVGLAEYLGVPSSFC